MRIIRTFIILFMIFVLGCFVGLFLLFRTSPEEQGDLIAVLKLQGIIVNYEDEENTIDINQVIKTLEKIEKSKKYKGILLVVDSPGGMAAPSLELTYKIKKIKETKPVIAYIQNLGASGAYYFSSAANWIIANPQSIIGSIGVIISVPQVYKALDKIGIEMINIKSGKYKDSLSPFKPLTKDQKDYFQNLVMEYYYQFVKDVAENRNLKTQKQIQELYEIADGRVFTYKTALKYRLIDQVGTIDNAKEKMKEILKNDKIKFVEIKLYKKTPLEKILGSKENISIKSFEKFLHHYGVWMIMF
ncbi:MAG: signal peptide peptidase SppA [bacterium]